MTAPFPFDAVLFDLDGTLVATERFWPDAARAGALAAFAELGLEREPPSRAEWMSLVGLPVGSGFDALFPDLEEAQWKLVRQRCHEAEEELLRDGRAAPLPGVVEVLDELRARGVRTGIASNCGRSYLRAMMEGLGLARWIDEARCLDTPGISSKADMVADLLATFGTRSAVMVGDRQVDRDAAWENGLPHVHLARGYAGAGEATAAEAAIEGMDALLATLRGRSAGVAAAWEVLAPPAKGVLALGGTCASGKSLLARDLVRHAAAVGTELRHVDLADYAVGEPRRAEDPFAGAFDLERLEHEVLLPARETPVLLEGPWLLHPRLRRRCDRLLWCDADPDVRLRRIAGREARWAGPRPLMKARSETMPLEAEFLALYPPVGVWTADLSNPLQLVLTPPAR